jgi:putative PIN family toxin of toxin-antitoxin system
MRVVLDTNVLLVSLPKKSEFRPIFDGLLNKNYDLLISNEILFEYAEIIAKRANPQVAHNVVEMLVSRPNVKKLEVFYRWNLIAADPDDNKFSDCAVVGNADYLVSDDGHFKILKDTIFPKFNLLTTREFLEKVNV